MIPNPKQKRIALKSAAWKRLVLEVFTRDVFTCQFCARQLPYEYLAPHHLTSVAAGGGDEASNLVTLCKNDHLKIHNGEISLPEKK